MNWKHFVGGAVGYTAAALWFKAIDWWFARRKRLRDAEIDRRWAIRREDEG